MSEDLIRREDAIEVVCEIVPIRDDAVEIADAIRAIPSADLNAEFSEWARHWFKDFTDRPRGEWIKRYGLFLNCSVCKHSNWSASFEDVVRNFNFCPNCGARMRGDKDD